MAASRERFLEGHDVAPGVRPVVLASWERCRTAGVDPHRLDQQVPDAERLAGARRQHAHLLACAAPFLQLLHELLGPEPHVVALAAPDATLLALLAGPDTGVELPASFEGASWEEGAIGSNGVGTCLAAGEPVTLVGPEHFHDAHAGATSIGVPVRGPSGDVAGALGVSIPGEHSHPPARDWTLALARAVEAALATPKADHGLDEGRIAARDAAGRLPPVRQRQLQDAVERLTASERQARRELAEIEAIYTTAPVGLGILDRDLRFVRINERMAEMNGLPAAAHIGRTVAEVLPDLAPNAEPLLRRVLETGEPLRDLELSGETPAFPGMTRTWIEHWLPLRDENGEVFALNAVTIEVTDQKRAGAEQQQLYEKTRSAIQERDSILALVSHDLRNPLSTIAMASSLLLEDLPEEKKQTQARIIRRAVEQMKRLVDDLLDASRIEGGGLRIAAEPCRAQDLLQAALEFFSPLAESRELVLSGAAECDRAVNADRERILQVFGNLISNAVEHTPPPGTISLRAFARGNDVCFAVSDSGRGIRPEDLPHVFNRYWQAREARRGGAGLGLAIARGIIEAHDGQIWVESEPGRGSTFFFTLPGAAEAPGPPRPVRMRRGRWTGAARRDRSC